MTVAAVVGGTPLGRAVAARLPAARYSVTCLAADAAAGAGRDTVRDADLVVLAVPDPTLTSLVRDLAVADAVRYGQRWVHLCRGYGVRALRLPALAGADTAACFPTVPGGGDDRGADDRVSRPDGAPSLDGAAWVVTARRDGVTWPERLVRDLGGEPIVVDDGARMRLDAALTVATVGVSAVTALARDLVLGAGVTAPERLLAPLVGHAAAEGARHGGAAVGAPVATAEAARLGAHAAAVAVELPEARAAHAAVLRLAAGYARRAGLPAPAAAAVAAALERGGGLDSPRPSA